MRLYQCISVLVRIFLLSSLLSFSHLANSEDLSRLSVAQNGVLKASDWLFIQGRPLPLTGEWQVIWGELVEPDDFDKRYQGDLFTLPASWNHVEHTKMDGPFGVATFRLKLELPDYNRDLSYHIVSPLSAWRFYVDDVYTGGNGVVSKDPGTFRANYISRFLPANDRYTTVVLQVANFSHAYGGPEFPITLWDQILLEKKLYTMSLWFVLALGTLFSVGLIHMVFYLADRKHHEQGRVHLWFSLLCFILVVRISGVIPYFHKYTPDSAYWSNLKLAYISLFVAPAVYLLFFRSAFPRQFPNRFTQIVIGLCLLLSVFVVITPENIYTQLRNLSIILNLFAIIFSLVFTARALAEREAGAGAIMIANFLFLMSALNDARIYMNHGNGFDMTPFGFMILGLGYSYALLRRLQKTFLEARHTSEALDQLNIKLEDQVRERTRAFKAAAAKARNTAFEKTRFIAAASHDLRQPLHALSMFNMALRRKSHKQAISDIVDKQAISIENMSKLLQDTLDTAKLDSAQKKPTYTNVHSVETLEKVINAFSAQAEERNVKLIHNVQTGYIYTDEVMFKRVIGNLVDNAIKAAKSKVEINATVFDDGWRFHVIDDGPGVPVEDVQRIFQSYVSLRNEEPGETGGYGLGLYVVNEFAKQLSGQVEYERSSEGGAMFTLTLPGSVHTTHIIIDDGVDNQITEIPDICVLAIDDDPNILDAMKTLLQSWACEVALAADLNEASQSLDDGFMPDIIIADFHLHRTTGIEVIHTLRQKYGQTLPAIVITGATETELLEKIRSLGLQVLQKPLIPLELWNILRSLRKTGRTD